MKAVAAGPAEALSENTSPAVATDREKDLPELAGTQSESQPAESPTEKQPETMSQLRARHLKVSRMLAGTRATLAATVEILCDHPVTRSYGLGVRFQEMKEHKKQMDKLGKKQKVRDLRPQLPVCWTQQEFLLSSYRALTVVLQDEIAARTNEIQERHAAELSDLKKALADDEGSDGGDANESADTGSTAEATAPQSFSELSLYGSVEKVCCRCLAWL